MLFLIRGLTRRRMRIALALGAGLVFLSAAIVALARSDETAPREGVAAPETHVLDLALNAGDLREGVVRLVVALRPTDTPTPAPTATPVPLPAIDVQPPAGPCSAVLDGLALLLFNQINSERSRAGLAPLAADPCVTYVAEIRAATMAANGTLAHSDAQGSSFSLLSAYGEPFGRAAENIARNSYAGTEAVTITMRDFMQSGGHRDNVLGAEYTSAGVGTAVDASGVTYFVVVFIG